MRSILAETKTLLCAWMMLCMFGFSPALRAQSISPYVISTPGEFDLSNKNWQKTVAKLFNIPENPPPFDKERTAEELLAGCAIWTQPTPDAMSHGWYRAATALQETRRKSAEQYWQMLQLYEAAARNGHYIATKQLTILYSQKNLIRYGYFASEPEKARYWINTALQRKWVGALEWVATALHQGSAQFPKTRNSAWRMCNCLQTWVYPWRSSKWR